MITAGVGGAAIVAAGAHVVVALWAMDQTGLCLGILAAAIAPIASSYLLDRGDWVSLWRDHRARSITLYALVVILHVALFSAIREGALLKSRLPELEADWRCIRAKELHNQDGEKAWCTSATIQRRSYLGDECLT
jgi:hypothetical protein